jgi:hypothetical protein
MSGCGTGVDSWVQDYEWRQGRGYVDVKSCHKIGQAITIEEGYGAHLDDVWKCAIRGSTASRFVDACYLVVFKAVSDGVPCTVVDPGCPRGGRVERQTMFLGEETDEDLAHEEALGRNPPDTTVRVEVFSQHDGGRKHCGYLDVRVPIVDEDPSPDPSAHAARVIGESAWAGRDFSFSYSSADD